MKYHISEINRDVDLDDRIVNLYQKVSEISDDVLLIPVYSRMAKGEISDKEMSLICNDALLGEMEMLSLMPGIEKNLEEIKKAFSSGIVIAEMGGSF